MQEKKKKNSKSNCSKNKMQPTTKIFVDGLREELMEQDLRLYFGRFGLVTDVLIIREFSEVIGYGFVTFQSSDSVEQIMCI